MEKEENGFDIDFDVNFASLIEEVKYVAKLNKLHLRFIISGRAGFTFKGLRDIDFR